jgi:hypothetical protein
VQADESTDTVNLLFVRYELNGEDHDDVLFCQPFPTRASGVDIFKVIDDFIKDSHLDWGRCVGTSTDGARAVTGGQKGAVARNQAVTQEEKSTHCCRHMKHSPPRTHLQI